MQAEAKNVIEDCTEAVAGQGGEVQARAAKTQEERWKEEAAFFDAEAERNRARLDLDMLAVQRYSSPSLRRRFNKEFRFRLMGPLEGKRILDVGCGDGMNAIMLAAMGAHVTGIDLSPKAIELAERRAAHNGVADKVDFICSPIETARLPDDSFDIIWGEGVLHHLLHDLDNIMGLLMRSLKPEGLFVFSEPVNLCNSLRAFRKHLPLSINGTPDERPMEPRELDTVGKHANRYSIRHYGMLGRLERFVLVSWNYERSPLPRRFLANCLYTLDYILLSLPGFRKLTANCVLYGNPAKP